MQYNIISTGSKGNAVILNDTILIDCGVPFKAIKPYVQALKLALLTHEHCDHFNPATIRKLQAERPTLRFGCGKWLINKLLACGVPSWRIDVYSPNVTNRYQHDFTLAMVLLHHNVPNCGYKLKIGGEKIFYATDTNDLDGIEARSYDLYMIEANYEDSEIMERIAEKKLNGQYAYEYQVLQNHLSKQKADDFIVKNAGVNSRFVYLHGHGGINFEQVY
jgi:phosphoribosyl 1,2-cyclic phosphodiesterase